MSKLQGYCEQCRRKLYPSELDICRLCMEYNEQSLEAHEAMYGREEREMAERREEEYEWMKDERDAAGLDGPDWLDPI